MEEVRKFLLRHCRGKTPLVLGYSGGPDSKALLYSLLEADCGPLHVAHVDHGWREESAREAELLRAEIASLGLPFHSTRLAPSGPSNKEERARKQRMAYFQSLFEKTPYQALLLGHQADDLAETSLKRLFEGAHLPFLGGMEGISHRDGITIWRPLLKTRRREILRYLEKRGLTPLYDPTNRDPAYLRARMREETLPFLNRSFGKEVVENLVCLSERAQELKGYLDRKIAPCPIKRGEWGFAALCRGLERVEQRHLLQTAAAEEGMSLPRTVLEPVLDWLNKEWRSGRKIFFQSRWITIDREWVFFLNSDSGKALPEKGLIRKLTIYFAASLSRPDQ